MSAMPAADPVPDLPTTLAGHAARLRTALESFDEQVPVYLQQWLDHRDEHPATTTGEAAARIFLERVAARGLEPEQTLTVLGEAVALAEALDEQGTPEQNTKLWVEAMRAYGELVLHEARLATDEATAQERLDQACAVAVELEEQGPPAEAAAAWRLIAPLTADPVEVLRRASGLDGEIASPWSCLGLLTLAGALLDGEDEDDLAEAEEMVRRAQAMALRPGFVRTVTLRLELDTARARLAGHRGDLEQAVTLASRALYLPVGEENLLATVPTRLLLLDLLILTEQWDRAATETAALRGLGESRQDEDLVELAARYEDAVAQGRN